jgi:bacterioferritin-associated ferredoxin
MIPMALQDDDLVCYCFHVPMRKVESFCRVNKPQFASQISECLSAGTGCGWCVPLLKSVHRRICGQKEPWWRQQDQAQQATSADAYENAQEYAAARQQYLNHKKQVAPVEAAKDEADPDGPASR